MRTDELTLRQAALLGSPFSILTPHVLCNVGWELDHQAQQQRYCISQWATHRGEGQSGVTSPTIMAPG